MWKNKWTWYGIGAVVVLLLLASVAGAQAQTATPMTLCTGGEKGNYYYSGSVIRDRAARDVEITIMETRGSWDNLHRLSTGECDAAIIQADAWVVWLADNDNAAVNLERVDTLYREYVHLACNREADIDDVGDLEDLGDRATIAVGNNGSGSAVTWQNFVLSDDDYGEVNTLNIAGARARTKVKDGVDAQCFIYVSGLNSSYMNQVNTMGDDIVLVEVDDGDFNDLRDPRGNRLYTFEDIPGGTYGDLQDGIFGSAVETLTVPAILVVNIDWINDYPDTYDRFIDYQLEAQHTIREHVGQ